MKKLLALFMCLTLLSGCTPSSKVHVKLYFASRDRQEILEEERAVSPKDSILETAIRALLDGPGKPGRARVIPKDTVLLGIKMRGTVAEINLSAPFDSGTDADRLLSRYTVIYTACAVPEVQKVKLLVEGKALTSLRTGSLLEALGASDLTLSAPGGGTQSLLTLYFADESFRHLLPEIRQITLKEGQTEAEAVVEETLKGPTASHLRPTVSPDFPVLSAEVRAGVCFVNVSRAFLEENSKVPGRESLAIYSFVNALCTLPQITEVRFLCEGETAEEMGQLSLHRGFFENRALYPSL